MSRGSDLLKLQSMEQDLRKRMTSYKKVKERLSNLSPAQKALKKYEKMVAAEEVVQTRQKEISLELQGLVEKIKSSEQELYSGQVKNPKELSNLQLETESLQKRRDKLEEETFTLIEQMDSLAQRTAQAEKKYQQVQKSAKERQETLHKQENALKRYISRERHRREKILAEINATDLELYRYVQRKKNDVIAVAELKNGVCMSCHIQTSSAKRDQIERAKKDKLLTCANCGRILVA